MIPPIARPSYFNSRPSARGDAARDRASALARIFQFTPLREGRRAAAHLGFNAHGDFNSRPSARGDGKRGEETSILKFQFTPLREGRRGLPPRWSRWACYFNSRPSARGDGKRYAISANLLFNPYKSAWLNNSATQFVEIILVIFHRIIV